MVTPIEAIGKQENPAGSNSEIDSPLVLSLGRQVDKPPTTHQEEKGVHGMGEGGEGGGG